MASVVQPDLPSSSPAKAPVAGGSNNNNKKAKRSKSKRRNNANKKAPQDEGDSNPNPSPSQYEIEQQSLQQLDDCDAYTSAWQDALESGEKWGGRARGGRAIRNGEGRDVYVHNITLTYQGKELLNQAELSLVRGRCYGLVGNNGVGKSTLLRRIAAGRLPGFSRHLTTMLVDQELEGDERTAVETVLACVARTDGIDDEISRLEEQLDNAETDEAREAISEQLCALYEQQEAKNKGGSAVPANADSNQTFLATEALKTLGLPSRLHNAKTTTMSGGMRMRVALARAAYAVPDVLLLDEPTNHLDLKGVCWLEAWLKSLADNPATKDMIVVVVSHDRAFLRAVATDVIEFGEQRLTPWLMNYEAYLEAKHQAALRYENEASALERKRDHVQQSIAKLNEQARAGDQKKSAQQASRSKKLERMGFERTPEGKKWKVSTMGYRAGSLDMEFQHQRGVAKKVGAGKASGGGGLAPFRVKLLDPPLLTGGDTPLLQLRDATFRYPNAKKADGSPKFIMQNTTLNVRMGEKVAIVGSNGQGKSTLLNILRGELRPTKGEAIVRPGIRVGYYSQHSSNALPAHVSALDHMREHFADRSEADIRNHLGSFGIGGDLATRMMGTLSGGQRARVVFAREVFLAPHVFLLDEPTNHLDIHTIEHLGTALRDSPCAVVVVSHNRDLVSALSSNLVVWEVSKGTIAQYAGTVEQYTSAARSQMTGVDQQVAKLSNHHAHVHRPAVAQGNFM